MQKIAMVTGASSGFGHATALLLAQNGFNVIVTARRKERLEQLSKEIKETSKADVFPLVFDVRDNKNTENAINSLPEEWRTIDVLVNNAGLALENKVIQDGDVDDWDQMLDTNVKGLLYVTKAVLPFMIRRGKGHIVNISSIAAKEVYEGGNVYCASKHAVDALTKGMRLDLLKHNIKVTSIDPGMAETEFSLVRFKGDAERAAKVYDGLEPLHALDVAEAILWVVNRPAHVNINDMLIMPTAQANATVSYRKK